MPVHRQLPLDAGAAGSVRLCRGGAGRAPSDLPVQRGGGHGIPAGVRGAERLCAGQSAGSGRDDTVRPGGGPACSNERPHRCPLGERVQKEAQGGTEHGGHKHGDSPAGFSNAFRLGGTVQPGAGGICRSAYPHGGPGEQLWPLRGPGEPGQHLAEYLRRRKPGAGHSGGGAFGRGGQRSDPGRVHRRGG